MQLVTRGIAYKIMPEDKQLKIIDDEGDFDSMIELNGIKSELVITGLRRKEAQQGINKTVSIINKRQTVFWIERTGRYPRFSQFFSSLLTRKSKISSSSAAVTVRIEAV